MPSELNPQNLQENPKKQRVVDVKTDGGNFLFMYRVEDQVLTIFRRGLVYEVPLYDLIEFGRTSERRAFRVQPINPNKTEDGENVTRGGFE